MIHMEAVQAQIEITRQQFIRQLEEEITLFRQELTDQSIYSDKKEISWDMEMYQKVIDRKLELISKLS